MVNSLHLLGKAVNSVNITQPDHVSRLFLQVVADDATIDPDLPAPIFQTDSDLHIPDERSEVLPNLHSQNQKNYSIYPNHRDTK